MKSMMFNSVSCVLATAVLMAVPAYAQKGAIQDSYAAVVKKALPAVVNISTSRIVRPPRGGELPQLPDFFDFFGFGGPGGRDFGPAPAPAPRERRTQSLGSGVVVSADGYILTNNHVVEEATDITVAFDDRREFSAKLIGGDALSDIALLKVEGTGFATLPMGNSDSIEVGDVCLAIGNPFGLKSTVTMGIISATGRGGLGIETYEDFIQTDAAINPGNSGGAMINTRGELIGINTAILSRTGGNQGIGFAIPINMAKDIMGQIRDTGKVSRGYMGAGIQDLTPELA
ncbi:MAG: trypsin-like peptidase domain-containing protein, partial [Bryobacteraceae bacterium]|nr:trypsin-like peptidase domain-containing protein [Bryobacteraceae bacterium]